MASRLLFTERRSKAALAVILVLLSGLDIQRVLADSDESSVTSSLFDSKYTLALGGFFPQVNSTFTLNGPGGGGTEIDMEDDLGLENDTSSAWLSFNWRFQPRHQLQVEFFQLNRKGVATADRIITIDNTMIGVGASLNSKVDLDLGRVTYGYSIIRKNTLDLSILVGVHIATAKGTVSAAGNVSVDGVPVVSGSVTESSSPVTFPLPHLGGSLSYEFTPRLAGNFTVLAFALDLGDYSGSLLQVDAMMAYQLSKYFGIGGGLKFFNVDVQANQSGGGNVEFNYNFFGPAIFGYASF